MLFSIGECLVEVVAEYIVVSPPNVAGGGHDMFQTFPELRALLGRKALAALQDRPFCALIN